MLAACVIDHEADETQENVWFTATCQRCWRRTQSSWSIVFLCTMGDTCNYGVRGWMLVSLENRCVCLCCVYVWVKGLAFYGHKSLSSPPSRMHLCGNLFSSVHHNIFSFEVDWFLESSLHKTFFKASETFVAQLKAKISLLISFPEILGIFTEASYICKRYFHRIIPVISALDKSGSVSILCFLGGCWVKMKFLTKAVSLNFKMEVGLVNWI